MIEAIYAVLQWWGIGIVAALVLNAIALHDHYGPKFGCSSLIAEGVVFGVIAYVLSVSGIWNSIW